MTSQDFGHYLSYINLFFPLKWIAWFDKVLSEVEFALWGLPAVLLLTAINRNIKTVMVNALTQIKQSFPVSIVSLLHPEWFYQIVSKNTSLRMAKSNKMLAKKILNSIELCPLLGSKHLFGKFSNHLSIELQLEKQCAIFI